MEPKKLARALVERKLVTRAVIDQVRAKGGATESLADRLVADGLISEIDLLRVIAQETGTRFVSSHRLAELKVGNEALQCIPLEVAEEHDVLPILWDKQTKSLVLVMADPTKVSALERLPVVARADHLTVNVALPGTVRAAVNRCYAGKRPTRPVPKAAGECPQCGQPFFLSQLECGRCGLLLNPDAPVDRTDSRIVRALLKNPTGEHDMSLGSEGDFEGPTRLGFAVQVEDDEVPELVAGLDIAGSLAELEALLVSLVDGSATVGVLSQSAGLAGVEGRSAIASLVERNVLRLVPSAGTPEVITSPGAGPEARPPSAPPPPVSRARPTTPGPPAVAPGKQPARTVIIPPDPSGGPPGSPSVVVSTGVYAPLPTKTVPSAPPPAALSGTVPPAPPGRSRRVAPSRSAPPPPADAVSEADFEEPTQGAGIPELAPSRGEGVANPAGSPAAPPLGPLQVPRHLQPEVQMENSLQHALTLERRGQITGAISVLKVAISRAPAPAPLYNRLALVILNQRRDTAQAEQLINKAIKLDPDNPVYQENLAKVLMLAAVKGKRR